MHSLKTIGLPLDLLSNPNRIQTAQVFLQNTVLS